MSTPSSQRVTRAARTAAREVNELLIREHMRAAFKVEKFGRHPDGYLHAQVSLNGERFYVHRKHGSWLMPGHLNGRPVLREVLAPFCGVLQRHARPFDDRDRRAAEEERDARKRVAPKADAGEADSPAAATAGLPDEPD